MTNNENTHPVLFPGLVVAGVEIKSALNAKRLRVLNRRKNGLFGTFPERGGVAGIESLFYCLSLDSASLAGTFGLTLEEWDEQVEQFALSLPDGGIEDFAALFNGEEEAIKAVSVEPEDAGKDAGALLEGVARNRTQLPPSSPLVSAVGLISPQPKPSPSSISCSTSTLTGSATA